jgi:hypothetical protein
MVAFSITATPANAAPLLSQNPGLQFNGDPSIGGTVYAELSYTPERSTSVYKWTSGKKVVATTSSFVIPSTMKVGQPLQVSVTNAAPGYRKWSYLSPIIKVGQITVIKPGERTGQFIVGRETSYATDTLFPPVFGEDGRSQMRTVQSWKMDGVPTSTTGFGSITPTTSQIGQQATFDMTYTFGSLPPVTVPHTTGKVTGFFRVYNDGALSDNHTVGETVFLASAPSWDVAPDKVTYQWFRDRKALKGQTKNYYKFVPEDYQRALTVKITATKLNYQPRVVELGKFGVLKEVTVSTKVTDGYVAWEGCEGYELENILCMRASANPKWMGGINLVRTEDDLLYASFSVPKPQPSGYLLRWKVKVVGISSVDLFPYAATGPGSEFVVDQEDPSTFKLSANQKKDSTWTSGWFTALPDYSQNLNFGLVAFESGSFVIKSVQITAVYRK